MRETECEALELRLGSLCTLVKVKSKKTGEKSIIVLECQRSDKCKYYQRQVCDPDVELQNVVNRTLFRYFDNFEEKLEIIDFISTDGCEVDQKPVGYREDPHDLKEIKIACYFLVRQKKSFGGHPTIRIKTEGQYDVIDTS